MCGKQTYRNLGDDPNPRTVILLWMEYKSPQQVVLWEIQSRMFWRRLILRYCRNSSMLSLYLMSTLLEVVPRQIRTIHVLLHILRYILKPQPKSRNGEAASPFSVRRIVQSEINGNAVLICYESAPAVWSTSVTIASRTIPLASVPTAKLTTFAQIA
jgi:hypothetical protein